MLGPHDPLPPGVRRILVAGTSGSGKTTLAARLSLALDIPHIEIDALFHGPGWEPREAFLAEVAAFTGQPSWVTEWQYAAVRDLLADRAELLVWLDLPRSVVMSRVVSRTVRRAVRRETLWNGNREPGLHTMLRDPDHIVRWAWRTHGETPAEVAAVARRRPDLPMVRLRTSREVVSWLDGPVAELSRR